MTLNETLEKIKELDGEAMRIASARWDSIAKPLHSLGKMEEMTIRIAGITGDPDIPIAKKALAAFCADNGVVEEGVTQTGQEVTAIVAENFLSGDTTSCALCRKARADVFPVDMGMARDTKVRTDLKVAMGTRNMAKEPAMSRDEALKAIQGGITLAEELKQKGYQLLAVGEMGIGNTTTSSAMASVLLDKPAEMMTGRGAGLDNEGLVRKTNAIKKAIALHRPDPSDPVDVLAKVGGFDIGGMIGLYLGAAANRIPVVLDGFISCVAALAAVRLCPVVNDYLLVSHVSKEPATQAVLGALGKEAMLHGDMCLGEGTGAIVLFPVLDMAVCVYHSMSTFSDIHVEAYEDFAKYES
ncbi:MAG: nicotinate-nucleotide--dimethylbenzimidazole phosphoribosyltransferase [Blautia sp.]|nr:nicotinate-nucleotide--dimethylbenzimidazole phosphoribosyltransferase [Blautia sp.]